MSRITRRKFNVSVTAAGIATALTSSRVQGANDRIRLGIIGPGDRGTERAKSATGTTMTTSNKPSSARASIARPIAAPSHAAFTAVGPRANR